MNLYEKIPDLIRENQSFVIATVTKTTGSVPGKTGFKMVVTSEGKTYGTVGGGELEQQVKKECLQRIGSGEQFFSWKNAEKNAEESVLFSRTRILFAHIPLFANPFCLTSRHSSHTAGLYDEYYRRHHPPCQGSNCIYDVTRGPAIRTS